MLTEAAVMAEREPIPREIELSVLNRSRRRCALCFERDGDLTLKRGEIAHLDQDPENSDEDSLAFLCMVHGRLFDSWTSQHPNDSLKQVKAARDRLYQVVAQGRLLSLTNLPGPSLFMEQG